MSNSDNDPEDQTRFAAEPRLRLPVVVRPLAHGDMPAWIALRQALWSYEDQDELAREAETMALTGRAYIRLAFDAQGEAVGLLEFSVRDEAPGSGGRAVPYAEGWYVAPAARGAGVGRALLVCLEDWAQAQGYSAIGSDTIPSLFPDSTAAHVALGFRVVGEGPDADGDMDRFFYKQLV
jgi:aminoglycoside 6'-N-acetyltransferase I